MNSDVSNLDLLSEGHNVSVYYQISDNQEHPTIIKVLKQNNPTSEDLARFYHEYEISQIINQQQVSFNQLSGVRKVYKKGVVDYCPALYLEYIEGVSLADLLKEQKKTSIADFFKIATALVQALEHIHYHHIVHCQLSPNHIIVMPDGGLRMIDFSQATSISRKTNYPKKDQTLATSLTYASPEQTGRMNQSVGYCSDLYSLGVIFYELLTGKPPFIRQNEMDLVHAHLAATPVPPENINLSIPPVLSQVVLKLLSKNTVDRYQSAFGLRADLEAMAHQLEQNVELSATFKIGQKDHSGVLTIPDKLYGRTEELELLREAYTRVEKGGVELVLVAGEPGSGKSRLTDNFHKKIARNSDFFIAGKYEQFRQQTPYSAIIEAFNKLFLHIISLPETALNWWTNNLQEAMGSNGKVLTDVMPDLEFIIGQQPPIELVSGQEAQNRFERVVQRFVKAVASKENPLILFLDDLQWADASSLRLLQTMLVQEGNANFLVIGVYRSNEVDEDHPFSLLLHYLKQHNKTVIHEITLQNLRYQHIKYLLVDALQVEDNESLYQLTELILLKTQGNAFFVKQFLQSLYEEGLLTFNFKKQKWEWDIAEIQGQNITDNVIDLMVEKISSLPANIQQLLKVAACLGNVFSINEIDLILGNNFGYENIFSSLWLAIEAVFVSPLDEDFENTPAYYVHNKDARFKFTHDHIEQATYSLWSKQEREVLHLRIAQMFLERGKDEHLFTITNHFNKATSLLKTKEDKVLVIRLNQQAAERGQKTNAYQSALAYYQIGANLMDDWIWEDYGLAFTFYYDYANCAYLSGNFEIAQEIYNKLLLQELDELDKAETYHAFAELHTAKGELNAAQEYIFKSLTLLNVYYPTTREEIEASLEKEFQLANQYYENISEEEILNAPMITSRRDKLLLKFLGKLDFTSYLLKNISLSFWLALRTVNTTFRHGNSSQASYAFLGYGICSISRTKKTYKGHEIGRLAIRLSEKIDSQAQKSEINYRFGVNLLHWASHQKHNLKYQRKAIRLGLESGNNSFTSYGIFSLLQSLLLTGHHLEEVKAEYNNLFPTLKRINPFILHDFVIPSIYKPLKQLLGETPATDSFDDSEFNEAKFLKERAGNSAEIFYTAKARNLYIFNCFEQGAELAWHYQSILESFPTFINITEGVFYIALHLLATYRDMEEAQQTKNLLLINDALEKLNVWAADAPMNFRARFLLVLAEKTNRVEKRYFEAIPLYQEAIQEARENEYIYIEAMAQERLADLWANAGEEVYARQHLQKAFRLYRGWGAKAKLNCMKQAYPDFLGDVNKDMTPKSLHSNSDTLDFHTLLKFSTTLTQELRLAPLFEKMVRIIAESAGAQRVSVIEKQGEGLVVRVNAAMENDQINVATTNQFLKDNQNLPVSLINYVNRSQKKLIITDAAKDELAQKDGYVQRAKPKSILCYPIVRQGRMRLIFYLENNLTAGAFTNDRLEVLKILSSQIAISIENAQLYENLEHKVEERTRELSVSNESLNQANKDLAHSNEEIKTVNDQLLELTEFKSRLTHMIIHDLKNPLAGIMGIAADESEGRLDKAKISAIARQMLQMTQNILDVQKNQEAQLELRLQNISVHRVSQQVIRQQQILASAKNIRLYSEHLPNDIIQADYDILVRILSNLISNAIKFTPENGEIKLMSTYPENKDLLCIQVQDSGVGIPVNEQDMIFDQFYSTDKAQTGNFRSTGLGLTFCKLAVEKQGGSIGVESIPGQGSTFWFTLPLVAKATLENEQKPIESNPVLEEVYKVKKQLQGKDQELVRVIVAQIRKQGANHTYPTRLARIFEVVKTKMKVSPAVEDWMQMLLKDAVNEVIFEALVK